MNLCGDSLSGLLLLKMWWLMFDRWMLLSDIFGCGMLLCGLLWCIIVWMCVLSLVGLNGLSM